MLTRHNIERSLPSILLKPSGPNCERPGCQDIYTGPNYIGLQYLRSNHIGPSGAERRHHRRRFHVQHRSSKAEHRRGIPRRLNVLSDQIPHFPPDGDRRQQVAVRHQLLAALLCVRQYHPHAAGSPDHQALLNPRIGASIAHNHFSFHKFWINRTRSETAGLPAHLVSGDTRVSSHPTRHPTRVTKEASVRHRSTRGGAGGVRAVAVLVTCRFRFLKPDHTGSHVISFSVESSTDKLLITMHFRIKIRTRLTLPLPPRRNLRHSGVVKALRLRPNTGIQNADHNVLSSLIKLLRPMPSPKP
nr:hypothetical protein CKAN_02524000 [Ipomoea trifida]